MDLTVKINKELHYSANIPKSFLNHLLANGYFTESRAGIIVLKIIGLGTEIYCGMNEVNEYENIIEIPESMNVSGDRFLHVEVADDQKAKLIQVQAETEDFASLLDPRSALEAHLSKIPVIYSGMNIIVCGQNIEIKKIFGDEKEEEKLDYAVIVNCDVKIDFQEPKIVKKVKPKLFKPAVSSNLEPKGLQLGGAETSREKWLKQFDKK